MGFNYLTSRPDIIFLKDMKIGQKFYEADYNNPLVYVLLDVEFDDINPNKIFYVVKIYKTNVIEQKTIQGPNARDRTYMFKFVRRDRSSFVAGFQACMDLYHKHMQIFDRQKADIENPFSTYMTMNDKYNKWVKNIK